MQMEPAACPWSEPFEGLAALRLSAGNVGDPVEARQHKAGKCHHTEHQGALAEGIPGVLLLYLLLMIFTLDMAT